MVKTKRGKPLQNTPMPLPGAVCVQWVQRGRKRHRYYARFWREGGKLRKQYVRLADVEAVTAACAAWRTEQEERRARRKATLRSLRLCRQLLREMGYDYRPSDAH